MHRLLRLLPLLTLLIAGCGQTREAITNSAAVVTSMFVEPSPTPTALPTATPTALPTATPTATPTDVPKVSADAPGQTSALAPPSDPVQIAIGSINLEQPLIAVGLDANRMPIVPRHDIGWYHLSAQPGQGENVVLWGHVLRFTDSPQIPAPFARLREVPVGDSITLYTADGQAHTYIVTEQVWATPDQVEYILPQGSERLTLVSCIGDKVIIDGTLEMSHRLITIAAPAW